jgi:phosphatidate cytidylyltransferase
MLAQRVATALVLLGILVPAIFLAPPWVWGVVSLALLTVAGHEWGRLLGSDRAGWLLGALLAAGGTGYLMLRGEAPATLAPLALALLVVSLGFWLTVAPRSLARVEPVGPLWAIGALVLAACWLALFELRLRGPAMLVSCMAVVWIADIGAYFAGRAFGRRKLAPRVSPGKSWEGVVGGMLAVVTVAAVASGAGDSWLPGWLWTRAGPLGAAALLVALAALSVVGDLYESLLKRRAGVKDSGRLLPGHGGVLDRIDALIPTMPGCLLLLHLLR